MWWQVYYWDLVPVPLPITPGIHRYGCLRPAFHECYWKSFNPLKITSNYQPLASKLHVFLKSRSLKSLISTPWTQFQFYSPSCGHTTGIFSESSAQADALSSRYLILTRLVAFASAELFIAIQRPYKLCRVSGFNRRSRWKSCIATSYWPKSLKRVPSHCNTGIYQPGGSV